MKIIDLENLVNKYSGDMTLEEVFKKFRGDFKYKCPKCKGNGFEVEEYNAYPTCLPDSGYVYKPGFREIKCDICYGVGYTKKRLVAKTEEVLTGYEALED